MFTIDFNNILSNTLGPIHGLRPDDIDQAVSSSSYVPVSVNTERSEGLHPFLNLPYENVSAIERLAKQKAGAYDDFIVLGIGGSALGASALHTALHPPFYNLLTPRARKGLPRLFVLDNVDPTETAALLNVINFSPRSGSGAGKKAVFNVISKSGETTETIASFLIVLNLLKKKFGKKYKEHLIITTDKEKGYLRQFARTEGLTSFETPAGVEGRYSVLSPVGLLPAVFTGIDIKALLKGAATVDKALKSLPVSQNPAFLAALVNYLYDIKKNKNILVLMPYAHQLKGVAEWFRQLYPESLGKRFDASRNEVNVGPTVLDVLGTTDQHSQIQLYNEGPNNKLLIFIEVSKFAGKISIPSAASLPLIGKQAEDNFLGGHSLAELMNVEKRATEYALVKNQRPNYTIKLDAITPETVGGLLYFLELVTAYAGKLYKVNPYNQPGVEAGKRATFGLLGRKGFEREIADINKTLGRDEKWMMSV